MRELEAEPTVVTGRQDPSPTMIEEGQEVCGGRTEERIPASGVVWNEAPESAIHSVRAGGVSPMVSHGAEGLCQNGQVAPPRLGQLLAGLSGRGPGRREEWSSASEHGRQLDRKSVV